MTDTTPRTMTLADLRAALRADWPADAMECTTCAGSGGTSDQHERCHACAGFGYVRQARTISADALAEAVVSTDGRRA